MRDWWASRWLSGRSARLGDAAPRQLLQRRLKAPTLGALPPVSLHSCASMRPRHTVSRAFLEILNVTSFRAYLIGFASHIPVLYREVPFILNIKKAARVSSLITLAAFADVSPPAKRFLAHFCASLHASLLTICASLHASLLHKVELSSALQQVLLLTKCGIPCLFRPLLKYTIANFG